MKLDTCTSFNINKTTILGKLVRLNETTKIITEKHNYPQDVANILDESIALACLLSASLKYDGLFTLQIQTAGAVSLVVVDVTSDGIIRACSRFDEEKIQKVRNPNEKFRVKDGEFLEAPHLLGKGHLAFTVDQGKNTDLYQGIVELKGNTLSECAMEYFKQSEQIETHLRLFLDHETNQSAAIMIQKIPGNETDFEEAVILTNSLKKEEIFNHNLSDEVILNRLFHANDLKVEGKKDYKFGCRCSRDKLLDTLRTFPKEEIESMCENNKITTDCNFCSSTYTFEKGEIITFC